MKISHHKMASYKLNMLGAFVLVFVVLFSLSSILQTSADGWTNIINNPDVGPSSGWKPSIPGIDPPGDQRTGSGSVSQDIVGDENYPSAYLQFSKDGKELAVRVRVNGCDGSPQNPEFKNFIFVNEFI